MRGSTLLAGLFALSLAGMATDAEARKVPKPVREKAKDYSKRAAEGVAQGEAWDAAKRTARRAKDKLHRKCKNVQGGNNANSTAAVRTCA